MKKYNVDKINALDIVQVARDLDIPLKKKGTKYWAQCLWHTDQNPSMVVGGSGGNFTHCFACGESSSVVRLIMSKLNCDFKTACQWAVDNYPEAPLLSPRGIAPSNSPRGEQNDTHTPGWKLKKVERLLARPKKEVRDNTVKEESLICFEPDILHQYDMMASSFARCLKEVFGSSVAVEIVRMYQLGSLPAYGRYPDVLFPSIDTNGNILDIKVQAYDCDERSDRFFHCERHVCYWLKSALLKREDIDHAKVFRNLLPSGRSGGGSSCLFGEHLLRQHPDKTIALVESPKNACVGAAAYPKYLWLATGNKAMLKREVLEVLRGRRVVVFPDEDAFQSWSDKLSHMQDIATFVLIHAPGTDEKRDIADFIIRNKTPQPPEGE